MQQLLTFITQMARSGTNAGDLIKLFSERLQSLYGPCAVAMISVSGLEKNQCQITVFVDEHNTTLVAEDNLKVAVKHLPVYRNDNIEQFLKTTEPCVIQADDPLINDTFGEQFCSYNTLISLPLFLPQGVSKWIVLLFPQPAQLKRVDIERILLIATLATNLGIAVENALELQQANQWIADEIKSVARIQQQLLPQSLESTPGIEIARRFAPYAQVGGDYYDIIPLSRYFRPDDTIVSEYEWGFMIADASGHGSAAAVEIAMFDAILRTYRPDFDAGPAGVFNYANQHLFTRTIRGSFITAFASAYLPQQRVLTYCNAGHPPPLLKPKSDPTKLIRLDEAAGIPLGVSPEGQWQSASVAMYPGDTLILYTDGLIEAVSEHGEFFGQDRLESIIKSGDNTPQSILNNIETALLEHQGSARQNDDQTLLVIQTKVEHS